MVSTAITEEEEEEGQRRIADIIPVEALPPQRAISQFHGSASSVLVAPLPSLLH